MVSLRQLLDEMIKMRASDLHISAGVPPQVRIDGSILPMAHPPLTPQLTQQLAYSVLTEEQRKRFETTKELDLSFGVPGLSRFRANVYLQRGVTSMAIRQIPYEILSFEQLGLGKTIRDFTTKQKGLVLVTGPTGSGKSTTLATMIDLINTNRAGHIITIEDPIEYVHHHKKCIVHQREINADTNTFVTALKYVLRQDPDVILIGEMRDLETMAAALTIAETGHLVLATLHTNDAPQAIDRIVDSFSGAQQQQVRVQLGACLAGVIYQQLVPAVGGGRVAAFEVLVANVAVRPMIKDGKTDQIRSVLLTNLRQGSQTLERSLNQLLRAGLVTERDARAHSLYPAEIQVTPTQPSRSRSAARP